MLSSSALREAVSFFEMLVLFYQTTRGHILEDSNVHENVIAHKMQDVPLHDNKSSKQDPVKDACHDKLQCIILFSFNLENAITCANV
jgi:hypothetical protein